MADLIGRTLGKYRIEARIGAGGMGEVYRGVHGSLNRPAAIKVMSQHVAGDPNFQERFKREARSAAALTHPNIVEVYDFGEENGLYYLVMELVSDGSLHTLMRRGAAGAPPSLQLLLHLIRQAAEGIGYAQRQGMTHRDIKPDNLLLRRQTVPPGASEAYTLKITDFGLARMTEGDFLTVTGAILGTPAYMSPEQCQGQPVDGRSDLYSLGVVLYEAATGYQPFKGASATEVMYKHVNTPPTPPNEVRPDLPEGLDDVILRCLSKQPGERFQNGADLARALDPYVGDKPAVTPAPVDVALQPQPLPQPGAYPRRTTPTDGTRMQADGPGNPPPPVRASPPRDVTAPHLRVMDANGALMRDVELTPGEMTIGRQPENAVVLEGDAVSRQHALIAWDGSHATLTDLNSANGTLLNGVRLLPRDPQVWPASANVRIGPYWLALDLPGSHGAIRSGGREQGETMRTVNPMSALGLGNAPDALRDPAAGRVVVGTQAKPEPLTRIAVTLEQDTLTITPGQVATFKVDVANAGPLVDHLTIHVDGVPARWIQQPEPTLQLNPGGHGTVVLTVNVERSPRNLAGTYPVTVWALSREKPGESGVIAARWTVQPFYADSMTLRPARARGRGRAVFGAELKNDGNMRSPMRLSGEDDEQRLTYQFSPPEVVVEPGAIGAAQCAVRERRLLFGDPKPLYPFTVHAQSPRGDKLSASGQFVNVPLLPKWVPSRAIMAAVLVAAALMYAFVLRPKLAPPFGTLTQATATVAPTKAPTQGPNGPIACADAQGFNGAQPATPIPGFGFPFPSNSVDLFQNKSEAKSVQFELYTMCAPGVDATGLDNAFNSLMESNGWTQSNTFPYQGNLTTGCGDPFCWTKSPSPQSPLYVSLEQAKTTGKVATSQVRLAIAPYQSSATIQDTPSVTKGGFTFDPSESTNDVLLVQNAQSGALTLQAQNGAGIAQLQQATGGLDGITEGNLTNASYGQVAPDGSFVQGAVFAVRTISGHYAKVLVTSAAPPTYTISWVLYALTFS